MRGSAASRLGRLAKLLRPAVAPYYVRRRELQPGNERAFPTDGWYWRPAGHQYVVFLGASEIDAAVTLHRLIDELIDEANDAA